MLGHEDAVTIRKGKLEMDPRLVWSDVSSFEQLLVSAQIQGEAGAEDEAVRLTEKALTLYRGHFLAGEGDKPWAAVPRTRIKNKFVLNTVVLGKLYQARGNRKKALDFFLWGLQIDPYAEELYQNLIQCHLDCGLRSEAISTYRDCRLALAELGLAPSSRTEAIYRAALKE
jgi:DNA-binding SARP family transcriptional activator